MEGSLKVKDAPEVWNEKFKEYLGIVPSDDAQGILQDVHWSFGGFGYFPTYALGNLVSAQLWECMNKDIPTLEEQVEKAQFGEILGWLRKNLHVYGAKFEPQTLVEKVTGSFITPEPYMHYLESKYQAIYSNFRASILKNNTLHLLKDVFIYICLINNIDIIKIIFVLITMEDE